MTKRMIRVVPPHELTVKNLEAPYYLVSIEMQCTSAKRHRRTLTRSELSVDGPPICEVNHCGMPMLPVSAEATFQVKSMSLSIKGDTTPRKRTRRRRGMK